MGQPSPPELSPAMSGALLFGADRKGRVDVHETHGAKLARAMRASSDSWNHQPPTDDRNRKASPTNRRSFARRSEAPQC
jgi:hypothetical protein